MKISVNEIHNETAPNQWEVSATAEVLDDKNNSIRGAAVKFFLDGSGTQLREEDETNEDGRGNCVFPNLKPGNYSLSARASYGSETEFIKPQRVALDKKETKKISQALDLRLGPPVKENAGWKLNLVARISEGDKAISGQKIQFFLDHAPHGKPLDVDANGVACEVLNISTPGKHSISAYVEGKNLGDVKEIEIAAEPKTAVKAAKIMPRQAIQNVPATGSASAKKVCIVTCQVLSSENKGVEDATVQVADPVLGIKTRKTNHLGFCKYEFDIRPNEDRRRLLLRVLGTDIEFPKTVYF